jgi:methylphosphotriester-DNA--protein-cysteine methyltransferase
MPLVKGMLEHYKLTSEEVTLLIRKRQITFGGNKRLKIYGLLQCRSGKRMLRKNRVFFSSVDEATKLGYRPCGHCMKKEYKNRKENNGPV